MRPLYGLYLAGGQSSRMGSPKWALNHSAGVSFLDHATEQLEKLCEQVFVSTASHLSDISYEQICDDNSGTSNLGPLGGLLAAHLAHPETDWLVLACDLPAMHASELTQLLNQEGEIVAFANPIDGVPEATATLYRALALKKLKAHLTKGTNRCMRAFLESHNLTTLDCPNYYALQNVNYPADYAEWQQRVAKDYNTPELSLSIEYYAKLKQDAGFEKSRITTRSITIAGLWEECRFKHGLSLKLPSVKPAVNNAFVNWDYKLQSNDLVAFMPPFAGG